MPQTCSICIHADRLQIEASLIAGMSLRDIARQFSVSKDSVSRHKQRCMKPAIQELAAEQKKEQEEVSAWTALSEMEWMREQARLIYTDVRNDRDHRTSLQALGELRKQTELYSELTGELDRSTHVELHQEWLNMREIIFQALAPFPDARIAVARALLTLEHQDGSTRLA
jgi:transposase